MSHVLQTLQTESENLLRILDLYKLIRDSVPETRALVSGWGTEIDSKKDSAGLTPQQKAVLNSFLLAVQSYRNLLSSLSLKLDKDVLAGIKTALDDAKTDIDALQEP